MSDDDFAASRYIVIPNWQQFQHYKDRTPLWIKNYTELMSDDAYLGLTLHQRGVLHGLWMEYARARRQIPDSTSTVSRRLGERVTRATLNALNHAGFIAFSASSPLAPGYQPASPEVEKSREENKDGRPEGSTVLESKNPPTQEARPPGESNFLIPARANGSDLSAPDYATALKQVQP